MGGTLTFLLLRLGCHACPTTRAKTRLGTAPRLLAVNAKFLSPEVGPKDPKHAIKTSVATL